MLLLAAQVFRRGQRLRNEMSPWAVEVHGGVDVAQVMPELLVALFVRRGFAPVFLCVVRCVSVLLPGGSLRSPGLRPRIVWCVVVGRCVCCIASGVGTFLWTVVYFDGRPRFCFSHRGGSGSCS